MALVFYKEIVSKGKKLIKPAILSAFLIIPLLLSVTSAGQGEKLSKTTIFGYTRPDEYEQTLVSTGDTPKLLAFFHSPILENGLSFLNHYLNHFSPDFLFVNGPINDGRQYVYGMGMLYLTDILFLVSGLHFLGKAGVSPKYKKLLLLWLLLSPIPSAITRDQVHARRALELTAPLSIIIGAGMFYVLLYINRLKNGWIKIPILCCLVLSFAYCVIFYLTSYYIFTPNRTAVGPSGWQCGYKEIVAATQKYKNVYSKIVVDTSYQGPYIFYLFYEKYSPAKYQTQAVLVNNKSDTLGEGGGYANYEFRSIYWPEDRLTKNTLFIGPPERLPEKDISDKEAKLLEKVYFHENKYLFHIVETF
ncbi:MAG: hypothetical protein ACD_52C00258G0001 [uncultured bacterium]|nr:MAG: hypothetical protein ACD_52C00258G0001 [uncultured bacterium]